MKKKILSIISKVARPVFSLISITVAILYVFKWRKPGPDILTPGFFPALGLRWLESAMIVSFIMSAFSFFVGLCGEKRYSELSLSQKIGKIIGGILYASISVLLALQIFATVFKFEILLLILIIVALIVAVVDALLQLPVWVLRSNLFFFLALLLIYIFPRLLGSAVMDTDFILGFHSGAAAFLLILVNLNFEPKLYIDIFKKPDAIQQS
jgi:hypothetical protein